ncbi:efflux RND transporter periplasmic adaptor subunit [Pseudoxanthomonas sp. JBR18]|uniref:efflux RND transporter periplasmic adaptor subunit n=1 Tax=Pseudoxanthomonas sp. JBR18 TaxID=2969308 RepID=UPI002306575C|nr:efflux RND transporter periplasmic adaptor subunit [Pseudoxanthomonas sp. JBR18]WCE03423.1 efflux RND transporter periplasmic adaptor subunit [Pseudoxanthomonas sp. JBR18]
MNLFRADSFFRARRLSSFALLALSVAVIAGCNGNAAETAAPPPPAVSVAPVLVKPIKQWDEFSGRIEAVQTVQLRPRVSGYIESVNYHEGEEVRAGDVLFTIDARSYRAALEQAQAELARARSAASQTQGEADRAKKLTDVQAMSTELFEQRRAAANEASAQVQAAQAAVDAARLDLDWTKVRAPISGRAGRALVTAGNLVGTGESASVLTTVVSDQMHVHFDADEATFLRYQTLARDGERPSGRDGGLPVKVGLVGEDGYPHQGQVDFVDNQLSPGTGTIRVRALMDNNDHSLVPGLFARVQLPGSGEFKAMLVDDKAVLTDQDRKYVYVVDAEGKAQRRDVQLGRMADGLRIVNGGLKAGDKVIVDGVQKVFMPGMPVQAKEVAMQAPPAKPVEQRTTAMN